MLGRGPGGPPSECIRPSSREGFLECGWTGRTHQSPRVDLLQIPVGLGSEDLDGVGGVRYLGLLEYGRHLGHLELNRRAPCTLR